MNTLHQAQNAVEIALAYQEWGKLPALLEHFVDHVTADQSLAYNPLLHPNQAIYLLEYAPKAWHRLQQLPNAQKNHQSSKEIRSPHPHEIATLFIKHANTKLVENALTEFKWRIGVVKAMLAPKLWNSWTASHLKTSWLQKQIFEHPHLGRACLVAQHDLTNWVNTTPPINIPTTANLCILFGPEACVQHKLVPPHNLPPIASQIHKLRDWNPKKDPAPFNPEELAQLHCWVGSDFLASWGLKTTPQLPTGWPASGIVHVDNHQNSIEVYPANIRSNQTTFAVRLNQNTALLTSSYYVSTNIEQLLRNHGITVVDVAEYHPFNHAQPIFCNDAQHLDFHNTFAAFCGHDSNWNDKNPLPLIQQWLNADPSPLQHATTHNILSMRLKLREITILSDIKHSRAMLTTTPLLPELRQVIEALSQFCPETPCHPDSLTLLL